MANESTNKLTDEGLVAIQQALMESGLPEYNLKVEKHLLGDQEVYYIVCYDEAPPFRVATIYVNDNYYDAELVAQIFVDASFIQEHLIARLFDRLKSATDSYIEDSKRGTIKWLVREITRRKRNSKPYEQLIDTLDNIVSTI